MGKSKRSKASKLNLEGRLLSFVAEGQFPKGLWLANSEGERYVKLSKKLRSSLGQVLIPGDWIQITGKQKLSSKTGRTKLKALKVKSASPKYSEVFPYPKAQTSKTKPRVMVCQKAPCMKRGAQSVCQALETALGDRGLEDQVSLKRTGCMNHCKTGPNVVFMPDKTRYTRVHPEEVPELVEKHLLSQASAEENAAPASKDSY